jgi:aryl-alcohol dehydrogenase-like predicted oxidoreductase
VARLDFARRHALGFGLAAVGRPAYINLGRAKDLGPARSVAALERSTHALLDVAFELGIRYVDAARSYGRAEEFMASWLERRGLAPGAVTVGSKWGYTYTGEWRLDADAHEVKDHSVAALRRQWRESRSVLGDRLQLYQIHSATHATGVLEDRAVLEELARMSAQGLVIGLTVSGPQQAATIHRALEVNVDGTNPFRVVQATWNVLEPSAAPALAAAHDAGWETIVKEALANGRLTSQGTGPERSRLDEWARRQGATLDQCALAAALANPWSDVVLSGAGTPEQLGSNAGAVELRLPAGELEQLSRVAESPERYWDARSALSWS